MRKFLVYFLAAASLVSCTKEWVPEPTLPEDGLVEKTWTVAMSDGTRATLDESLRPVWEVKEQVSVYDHVSKKERIFQIVSIDGGYATISGRISNGGDRPFDAVYPASCAGKWSSDGTNALVFPATQQISSGRNISPDALISTAHCDSPDGGAPFHNVSSLLKVRVGRENITRIEVSLVGSSEEDVHSYKLAAQTGALAQGVYFIAVDPGTYAGGVRVKCTDASGLAYLKSSANPLEAAAGGIKNLGTVSDGMLQPYYRITGTEKVYSSAMALLDDTGLTSDLSYLERMTASSLVSSNFPSSNGPVSTYSYIYRSVDPQGNPLELSARIYIPQDVLNGKKSLSGITLASHSTMTSNGECPSEKAQAEGIFAWRNHAVVMPDYYGLGASKSCPQAFLDAETTARGNLDAYFAALLFLEDQGVANPDNLFSVGYTQGGFNAMATLKYVTQHPELGVTVRKTFCVGSPFDVPLTLDTYLGGEFAGDVAFLPLLLVSINESQQLNIPYDHLFKGELLANWQSWILSKDNKFSKIGNLIGTDDLSEVLADGFLARTGPDYEAILNTCRRYSLTSGWTPPPATTAKIFFYHSENDDVVPFGNFTSMQAFLDETIPNGYESESVNVSGSSDLETLLPLASRLIDEW